MRRHWGGDLQGRSRWVERQGDRTGVELERLTTRRVAIDGIANDGAANRGAVDAQLVGASSAWPQFEPGAAVSQTANPIVGDRLLTDGIHHHMPAGAAGQLFEAGLDAPFGFRRPALDDGPIDLSHSPAGEQDAEPPQRFRMAAQHQAAAGIAIEAM